MREGENMNPPVTLAAPNYVTCPCQHCSGNIEFDANQLDAASENTTVLCPYCGLETIIFVPEQKVSATNPDILDLNPSQLAASTFNGGHALVLAGAGCGKTKTIIARCEHLIANGVPASRIYVMTFTRKAAAEITSRVSAKFGSAAKELKASTFHSFCMAFIHQYPQAFGCQGYTIIDRDDQIDLMKAIRGYSKSDGLPTAGEITDIYSLARNTRCNLSEAITNYNDEYLHCKEKIAPILRRYEERKRQRKYLDYDDILDVVATQMRDNPQIRGIIASRFSHILVDEFQDTNNLQWSLLDSLKDQANMFCVGDDAQSIYGFRGADFKTIHSFTTRVQGATVLKLEDNYRSTQEILNLSNWLLEQSPLSYGKKLNAVRGAGKKPRLLNFISEWDEAAWIGEDLLARRREGADWCQHMILVRANWSGRAVETHLIERKIPYIYIGGTALFKSAHVKDVLSALRIVANSEDELAWVRYLRLWPGIGEVTANRIVERILDKPNLPDILNTLAHDSKAGGACRNTIDLVAAQATSPVEAFRASARALESLLARRYATDWDRRRRDFTLVEKLAEKHSTILGFIEEYILDPIYDSEVKASSVDAVTLITVHSAKGTEAKVCYVINASPGSYPSEKSMSDIEDIEEERRVLYVALTRAKDELIVSRRNYATHAVNPSVSAEDQDAATAYFFNNLPADLVDEEIIAPQGWQSNPKSGQVPATGTMPKIGIIFDSDEENVNATVAKEISVQTGQPDTIGNIDQASLAALWLKLLETVGQVSPLTRAFLFDGHPISLTNSVFTIGFTPSFGKRASMIDDARDKLIAAKLAELGHPNVAIKYLSTGMAKAILSHPAEPTGNKTDTSLAELWLKLIEAVGFVSPFTRSYLVNAHPVSFENNIFTIGFAPEYKEHTKLLDNARNHTLLATKLAELGHHNAMIKFIKAD